MGGPGPGHPQRHRPDAFVGIGFRKPTVLEDRHGAPADVVVEAPDRLLDDARGRRATGAENGLGGGHDRKRPLERPGRLMLEEVAVKPPIARQHLVKHHPDQRPGLAGIAEGRLGRLQLRQALPQQRRDIRGRIGPFPVRLGGGNQIGTGPPNGRIKDPGGEIEIPEKERGWIGGARRFRSDRHRQASYGSPPAIAGCGGKTPSYQRGVSGVGAEGGAAAARPAGALRSSSARPSAAPRRAGTIHRSQSRGYGCTAWSSGVVRQRWCAGGGGPFGSSLRCVACPFFGPGRCRRCFPP